MKRVLNIIPTGIMLILMLMWVSGVSVEKCSCTGRISLAMATDRGCCPDEGGCMTLKSMQLSEYQPATTAIPHVPVLPVMFTAFCSLQPVATVAVWRPGIHCAETPPGPRPATVTVLRV